MKINNRRVNLKPNDYNKNLLEFIEARKQDIRERKVNAITNMKELQKVLCEPIIDAFIKEK